MSSTDRQTTTLHEIIEAEGELMYLQDLLDEGAEVSKAEIAKAENTLNELYERKMKLTLGKLPKRKNE